MPKVRHANHMLNERDPAEIFAELPANIRATIATARNVRARERELEAQRREESKRFKALVVRLYRTDGLSRNKISRLLDLSWDRIDVILQKEGAR